MDMAHEEPDDRIPPITFADIVDMCQEVACRDRPSERDLGITLTSMFERDDTKIIGGLSPEDLAAIVDLVANGSGAATEASPALVVKLLALVFSGAVQPIASSATIESLIADLDQTLAHRAIPNRTD